MGLYARYLKDRWGYNPTYANYLDGESTPVTRHNYAITMGHGTTTSGQYVEGSFGYTLAADDGYALPGTIAVKSGSTILTIADYTYNQQTGFVMVSSTKANADITITGECIEKMSWNKFNAMTWDSVNDTYWSEINS